MGRAAARTANSPTAIVACEQLFPEHQRILTDDMATSMLPFGARVFLWLVKVAWARDWMVRLTERIAPGLWGGMLCRKRYIDEKLVESVGRIGAVVNIGAGFDTRLYRLQAVARIPAWETDQRENIEAKRKRLQEMFGSIPKHVTLLAIDFDSEDLSVALAASGFPAGVPTFFIWEAVMQYLTEPAVMATFDFLAKAAKGSRLVFTYVRKDFIEGRVLYDQDDMYKRFVQTGVWLFGMDPRDVSKFLLSFGWRLVEDLDYGALAERYVMPTGRQLKWMSVERIAYAEKL